MMIFGSPLLISPIVRYGATAAVGALAAWWGTATYYGWRIDAIKAKHDEAMAAAQLRASEAESRIQSTQTRVIERVIVKQAAANSAAEEAKNAINTDQTPSLHDPRCAWPDRVRDAVARARAASQDQSTPEPASALRDRSPRPGRDDAR